MVLLVKRGLSTIAEIPVFDTFLFSRSLMQEHKVTINNLTMPAPLPVQLNDYIIHNGIKYTINTVPNVDITNVFVYTITFEGPEYTLYDKIFMHEGDSDIVYFGTPEDHLDLLLENINTLDPGWTKGTVEAKDPIHISYENQYCRTALKTMAEAFKLEYSFDNKVINMVTQVGVTTTHEFEYGMGKGLYSLKRNYVNEMNVKTKVYGFGSTRNLPVGYRGGAKRLTFDERFILQNEDLYGVKEFAYTDEEIFPTREGDVTAVGAIDTATKTFSFTDSTLDFNVNTYLLGGLEAKVAFNTGDVTGEEFVIKSYNDTTKTFVCYIKVNESSITLPSVSAPVEVGNKYILLDISLPPTYVTAAELKVKNGTTTYTNENSVPRVEYDLIMDILYVKTEGIALNPGDKVRIKNTALGIDHLIRVNSVSYPMTFPEVLSKETKYNVTISNFVSWTIQERTAKEVIDNKTQIKLVDRRSIELARRNTQNWRDLQDLFFDPDGYLDPGLIKPESIQTGMLAVNIRSQSFRFREVNFNINYEGDPNKVYVTAGWLEHFQIQIPGLGFSWFITAKTFTGLDSSKAYYMYAKCSKSALTGEFMMSDVPVYTEGTPGYYNFNIGILYKVNGTYRDQDFTYGSTTIVGDNITTGRVQDITKQNYFDLRSGKFNMGPPTGYGVDWDVTNPNRFTIRGGLTQNPGGATFPIPAFRGPYDALTTYYEGETVTYLGNSYTMKYPTPVLGILPTNSTYWEISAISGEYTEFRYQKNTSDSVPPSLVNTDFAPSGWATTLPSISTGEYIWKISSTKRNTTLLTNWTTPQRFTPVNGEFTEIRYAKNSSTSVPPSLVNSDFSPVGWSTAQPSLSSLEYLWRISATKRDTTLLTNWTTPQRFTPIDGTNGAPGARGPFALGRGNWDAGETYIGTADHVEVVKYGSLWYVTRTTAGSITPGTLPTNPTYWNVFGATFESVATDLLFATLAYIDNLGVRFLRTNDTEKRISLSGVDNNMEFFIYDGSGGLRKILIDDDAAIIGYSGGGSPIYGAGILIGNYAGNYSSLSETAINTGDFYARGYGIFGEQIRALAIGTEVGSGSGSLSGVGLVLANGNCSLYDYPDDLCQMQTIKNTTNGNITVSVASGATSRRLYDLENNLVTSLILPKGDVYTFQYYKVGDIWVQIGNNN